MKLKMVERLGGPHEWGYRDITGAGFVKDDTPFDAADLLDECERALLQIVSVRYLPDYVDKAANAALDKLRAQEKAANPATPTLAKLREQG